MKKLGFGCMRFPLIVTQNQTSFDKEQIFQMVDCFLERGFTYFDTAYMYHDNESENMVREALVERHSRDSFLLATKMPTMMLHEEADMERIFAEQLKKCGVDYFDYYLLHCLTKENYEIAERLHTFSYLSQQKAEGRIKRLGFSFHDTAALLEDILIAHPETEFVQLQINYLDWESESVQARKCYEVCRKYNKEIIVMEPVKGGTLAKVPLKAEKLLKRCDEEASIASWAVRFAAGLDGVICVLSGMSNMEQMLDNTSFMQNFQPLTQEETKKVFEVADIIHSAITIPCTACRYCVEGCPQNIPIPDLFAIYNEEKQEIAGKSFTAQETYYENLCKEYGKASDCIACRQCESHCPQHIIITEFLSEIAEVFDR